MFIIADTTNIYARREISRHSTFEEAVDTIKKMPLAFLEEDAEHPGCADAFTKAGLLLTIQPEGFGL